MHELWHSVVVLTSQAGGPVRQPYAGVNDSYFPQSGTMNLTTCTSVDKAKREGWTISQCTKNIVKLGFVQPFWNCTAFAMDEAESGNRYPNTGCKSNWEFRENFNESSFKCIYYFEKVHQIPLSLFKRDKYYRKSVLNTKNHILQKNVYF